MNIIILVGISGSGKSTWAKECLIDYPNYVCINRDAIRLTLVKDLTDYYQRKDLYALETVVTGVEDCIYEKARFYNYDLIVDNTNLQIKYIQGYIRQADNNVTFKLFDCHVDLAKARVGVRDKLFDYENLKYIEKQAKQYEQIKKQLLADYKDKLI